MTKSRKFWFQLTAAIVAVGFIASALPANAFFFNWRKVLRLGSPARRTSAGTRGTETPPCIAGKLPLIALVPNQFFSYTTADSPMLYVYLPRTAATQAELKLQNWENKLAPVTSIYQLPGKDGIVGFKLPAGAIAGGQGFRWTLTLLCDQQPSSDRNDTIEGWLKQIPADVELTQALERAKTLQQRLDVYAQAGLWQDGLTEIVQRRQNQPNDPELKKNWEQWLSLSEIGLNQLKTERGVSVNVIQLPILPSQVQLELVPHSGANQK